MMFKLFALQKSYQVSGREAPLRQVFVTKSKVLVSRVRRYFMALVDSCGILNTGSSSESKLHDASDGSAKRVLLNSAEEDQLHTDLPTRFSELSDEHFPLFITYDHVRNQASSCSYVTYNCV